MDAKTSVSLLINKLQDLLPDGATNSSFRKQVLAAIDNLHALKQFLPSSSSGGDSANDHRIAQILEAVCFTGDSTDALLIKKQLQEIRWGRGRKNGFRPFMSFVYSLWSQVIFTREMKKFNDEVRRLVETKKEDFSSDIGDIYCCNNSTRLLSLENDSGQNCQLQQWEIPHGFCLGGGTDVLGLERQINELVVQLIPQHNLNNGHSSEVPCEQDRDQSTTKVIALVGEGGSGKTTLARTVYDRVDVKRQFINRAWVRIPSVFKARDVLADILKQINQDELELAETLSEDALMRRLTKLLYGTSFLIVLEDVETPLVWETFLNRICSSSQFRGKLIITTSNANNLPPKVANASVLQVCRLNDEESWKLFLKKVRIVEGGLNRIELIMLKGEILKICGGLPSQIVLLGGLLSTKEQSYEEWSRVIEQANNAKGEIMAFIFQDLPSEVKPCFLYMGIFPKGFEIPVRRLIHLWCAEGFVTLPDIEEIDPEALAEMCFEELVIRNMIQVRWKIDGSPATCCMPSVLYDVFSPKSEAVGFFNHQLHSSHASTKQSKYTVRRWAAYLGIKNFPSSFLHFQNLRSYIAFDTRTRGTPAREIGMCLNKIISNRGFGLLNVLDLEGVYKPKLSDPVIGNLLQLSYLGLRSTFIDNLPESVGYLTCLETLDVRKTNVSKITLWDAKKLRHLYLNRNYSSDVSFNFGDSNNLQTLWGLQVIYKNYMVTIYRKLTRLRKLQLSCQNGLLRFDEIALWISQLTELQSLKLRSIESAGQVSYIMLPAMAEHHKLQELYLQGLLPNSVIDVHVLPPNLRNLTLSLSELADDPMPILGQLPHLNILRLSAYSYRGKQITCLSGGFPKLRLLKLWKLTALEEWIVEEGAMPCLGEVEIRDCNNFLKPPACLQNMTTLKELVLTNMPMAFRAAVEAILEGRNVYIKSNAF